MIINIFFKIQVLSIRIVIMYGTNGALITQSLLSMKLATVQLLDVVRIS